MSIQAMIRHGIPIALVALAGLPAMAEEASEQFRRLDKNQDGKVTRDEFSAPVFDRIDTNKDGIITPDEDQAFVLRRPKVPAVPPPSESFTYKQTPQAELGLDVYLPTDWKESDKRPAIVFFFGGGWTSGTITQFRPQAAYLASRGLVAVCADYRVKSRHNVTPKECVEDAKSAIRWVRQHAGTLGVDPNRIVASGGSAGAHIAACTALTPGLDAADEDLAISSKPNALVLFNPALDFGGPQMLQRIGGDEELGKAISPNRQLAKDSPPTLILFGTDDVLYRQGQDFIARAKENGTRAEMYVAEGAKHGFFNAPPWKERTLYRTDEFLASLGYVQGKPTIQP